MNRFISETDAKNAQFGYNIWYRKATYSAWMTLFELAVICFGSDWLHLAPQSLFFASLSRQSSLKGHRQNMKLFSLCLIERETIPLCILYSPAHWLNQVFPPLSLSLSIPAKKITFGETLWKTGSLDPCLLSVRPSGWWLLNDNLFSVQKRLFQHWANHNPTWEHDQDIFVTSFAN